MTRAKPKTVTPAPVAPPPPKRRRNPRPPEIVGATIVDKGIRGTLAGPDKTPETVQEDTMQKLDVRTCTITDPHSGPRRAAVIVLTTEPGDATTPAVVELVELPQPSRWVASAVAFD